MFCPFPVMLDMMREFPVMLDIMREFQLFSKIHFQLQV